MNTKDTLAFLGSLSSKICHDVVAPVSAIDMGLSLLEDHLPESLRLDPAYALLQDSINKTLRRINFFRYAFAFGKTDSPPSHKEFAEHCQNACAHFKIKFLLDEFEPPSSQQALFLRISACIVYLLVDTLPKGGTIQMSISQKLTSFEVSGPLVIANASLDKITQKVRESFRAQTILPELILMGLDELRVQLEITHTPTLLTALLR
jgi:hypothetical protein